MGREGEFYCVVFLNNQRRHPKVISLLTTTIPSLSLHSLGSSTTSYVMRRLAGRASIATA